MQPAGSGVGVIRQAKHQREGDEQQHTRDHRRDPHVVDPGRARRCTDLPSSAAGKHAIERRVQREEHQVVQHDRPDEPQEEPARVRRPEDEREQVAGKGETGGHQDGVGRSGAVEPPEPRTGTLARAGGCRMRHVRNLSSETHLVQCTPGAAGTIIRAGYPWSSEMSSPLTHNASSVWESPAWLDASVVERNG